MVGFCFKRRIVHFGEKFYPSGNIDKEQIAKLKNLNIDYISSGDLTKNIAATDYSLIFKSVD